MATSSNGRESRLLLIDADTSRRQLRSTVFRNCEIDLHTVSRAADAVKLCKIHRFNMVLLADEHSFEETLLICDALRRVVPRQRIAQLVGAPVYLREIGTTRDEHQTRPAVRTPRLTLVQPQRPQWSVLIDRVLAG